MIKLDILDTIRRQRLIGIIRRPDFESALHCAEACIEEGLTCLEIALTTPDGLDLIRTLNKAHGDNVLIGTGTVLDPETARLALFAGAKFLLAPSVHCDVIEVCHRYGAVSIPGAFSPTEIVTALRAGADIIKLFPGGALGPQYLKDVASPLSQVAFMPSGGVSLENIESWFASGAVAVGVGGSLTSGASSGDYDSVRKTARAFVDKATQCHRV